MGQRVKRHEFRHIQQRHRHRRQSDVNVNVNAAAKRNTKKSETFEFAVRSSQRIIVRASSAVAGAAAGARRCQLI